MAALKQRLIAQAAVLVQGRGTSTEALRSISEEVTRMQLRRMSSPHHSALPALPESPSSPAGPPESQDSNLPLLKVGAAASYQSQRSSAMLCSDGT